jgi:hypothetical protein
MNLLMRTILPSRILLEKFGVILSANRNRRALSRAAKMLVAAALPPSIRLHVAEQDAL